jgi:cytoskeletal protein CcmA (bactofilin family)
MSPDKFGQSTGGQSSLSVSTIGGDLTITGNVTSKGEIQLDGHVHGDVHCVALVLGENSNVEGNVTADDVVIRGRLIGSLRALRVTLQSTSHVEGDLTYQSLAIEQGAFFDGKSHPSENPLSKGQTTEDLTAIEPQPVVQSPEKRKKIPEAAFVRSLPEPNEV